MWEFGVDEMAPGQVLQSSPLNIILPMVHILIHSFIHSLLIDTKQS